MSELVETKRGHTKIGRFINQPAVFRSKADVACDAEIGAASVNKGAGCLPFCAADNKLLRGIKDHRPASTKGIRLHAAMRKWQVCDQRTRHFMKSLLNRSRTARIVILGISRVAIVALCFEPSIELIGITHKK